MIPRHLQIAVGLLLLATFFAGLYALRLKQKAEVSGRAIQSRPVKPPVSGKEERVRLMIAFDEDGVLREREATVTLPPEPALRAREVLRALLAQYVEEPSPHPLATGADIKDVYLVNGNMAVVDTTAEFAEGHRSGVLVESMTVASLVQTVALNVPGVTKVKILVDGKERETLAGHADLRSFFDISEVREFVQVMQ
jgi:hypothetical protein